MDTGAAVVVGAAVVAAATVVVVAVTDVVAGGGVETDSNGEVGGADESASSLVRSVATADVQAAIVTDPASTRQT